jgi:hypothetical protein
MMSFELTQRARDALVKRDFNGMAGAGADVPQAN